MKVFAMDYRRSISAFFKDIPNFWANWADQLDGTGQDQETLKVLYSCGPGTFFESSGTPWPLFLDRIWLMPNKL